MSIYKGNKQINKLYLGTTEINKVYLGDILILGSSGDSSDTSLLYLKDGIIYLKAGNYKYWDYDTNALADITLPEDTECFYDIPSEYSSTDGATFTAVTNSTMSGSNYVTSPTSGHWIVGATMTGKSSNWTGADYFTFAYASSDTINSNKTYQIEEDVPVGSLYAYSSNSSDAYSSWNIVIMAGFTAASSGVMSGSYVQVSATGEMQFSSSDTYTAKAQLYTASSTLLATSDTITSVYRSYSSGMNWYLGDAFDGTKLTEGKEYYIKITINGLKRYYSSSGGSYSTQLVVPTRISISVKSESGSQDVCAIVDSYSDGETTQYMCNLREYVEGVPEEILPNGKTGTVYWENGVINKVE